ncbi:flagellar protein FlaG [Cupriavidus basilensis]|uniref:flagellar protein FlaG n=1 Tax=Cupriavidus basilensis TaxID=68895 RepID=UPI0039F69F71
MIRSPELLSPLTATPTATPAAPADTASAPAAAQQAGSAVAQGTAASKAEGANPKELASALASLNDALRATPVEVRFSIDSETHRFVTVVVDKATGDTIRQFPSKEVLRITRAIDKLQGLLIHQTA